MLKSIMIGTALAVSLAGEVCAAAQRYVGDWDGSFTLSNGIEIQHGPQSVKVFASGKEIRNTSEIILDTDSEIGGIKPAQKTTLTVSSTAEDFMSEVKKIGLEIVKWVIKIGGEVHRHP